jgi:quercetin dioxygenase-like cupin family protein
MDPQTTPQPPGPGELAGSPQRPAHQLVGPVLSFDLAQEIATLRQEASWQRGDRNARTLVAEPSLRIVLTVLKTGARIREHRTDSPVVLQTLQGYIRVESPDETIDLLAARPLALEPGVPPDVEAIEQSAFLLMIAPPTVASPAPARRAAEASRRATS